MNCDKLQEICTKDCKKYSYVSKMDTAINSCISRSNITTTKGLNVYFVFLFYLLGSLDECKPSKQRLSSDLKVHT